MLAVRLPAGNRDDTLTHLAAVLINTIHHHYACAVPW